LNSSNVVVVYWYGFEAQVNATLGENILNAIKTSYDNWHAAVMDITDKGEWNITIRIDEDDPLLTPLAIEVLCKPDNTPPTVNITYPSDCIVLSSGDFDVTWTGDDNMWIDYYTVSVDGGVPINVSKSTSYTVSFSDGTHTVNVTAFDQAGNSGYDTVSFTVDTNPPEVSIIYPGDGVLLNSGDFDVTWTSSDTDIAYYLVTVDSGTPINVGLATSYHVSSLPDGPHTVNVTAVDETGNSGWDTVSFTVDTIPPNVNITYPTDNSVLNTGNFFIIWTGDDNIGIDHYEISMDGEYWVDVETNTSYGVENLTNGLYTFYVRAFDGAGNNATDTVSFSVKLT